MQHKQQKGMFDPCSIRTSNLLIWSQTRYRCANEPRELYKEGLLPVHIRTSISLGAWALVFACCYLISPAVMGGGSGGRGRGSGTTLFEATLQQQGQIGPSFHFCLLGRTGSSPPSQEMGASSSSARPPPRQAANGNGNQRNNNGPPPGAYPGAQAYPVR